MNNVKTLVVTAIIFISIALRAQDTNWVPTKRVKEFGLGFSGLNAYSLQYRWGNTKCLYRINANISGSNVSGSNSSDNVSENANTGNSTTTSNSNTSKTPLSIGTSVGFSVLFFKNVVEKFGLIYGPVIGTSYSTVTTQTTQTTSSIFNNGFPGNTTTSTTTTNSNTQTMQPYVGLVLGVFYKINNSFLVYAEIAPNVYYQRSYTTSKSTGSNSFSTSTSSGSTKNDNTTLGLASLTNSGALITLVYRITK